MAQAPITFGLPNEQADFVTRNAPFLEVLPRLTQRINEILAQRTFARDPRAAAESEEDWQRRVIAQRLVFLLGRLAVEDFMGDPPAVRERLWNGRPQAAAIHV